MDFKYFVNTYVVGLIGTYLVPIILAFTLIVFLYGLLIFLVNADDPKKHSDGLKFMFWGAVGLAIGLSVWSIVAVFSGIFGASAVIPQLK